MTAPIITVTSPQSTVPTIPTALVKLPSNGWYYDSANPLSKGEISLKYPTTRSEDILSSRTLLKQGVAVDRFIQSLIYDTSISYDSILLGDRSALLIAARVLAYGSSYKVNIECPECSETTTKSVDLSAIEDKIVMFDPVNKGKNELSFTLPFSKVEITYKLLTQGDEKLVETELESLQKKLKQEVVPEVSLRLKRCILSVGGRMDAKTINEFVDTMPTLDAKEFRAHVSKTNPDVDLSFDFRCPSCQYEKNVGVGITSEFFWPL